MLLIPEEIDDISNVFFIFLSKNTNVGTYFLYYILLKISIFFICEYLNENIL